MYNKYNKHFRNGMESGKTLKCDACALYQPERRRFRCKGNRSVRYICTYYMGGGNWWGVGLLSQPAMLLLPTL